MMTRRGFFDLLAAAVVAPKVSSSTTIFFDPPISSGMMAVGFEHNELLAGKAFDKFLVGISRSYHQERQLHGYWADSVFPIVKVEQEQ